MFELFPDENQSYEGMQPVFKWEQVYSGTTSYIYDKTCQYPAYFNMGLIYVSLQHICQTILF